VRPNLEAPAAEAQCVRPTAHLLAHGRVRPTPVLEGRIRLRVITILIMASYPAFLAGEEPVSTSPSRVRVATLTVGTGNAMGWLGLQGERYFAAERLSAFLILSNANTTDVDAFAYLFDEAIVK